MFESFEMSLGGLSAPLTFMFFFFMYFLIFPMLVGMQFSSVISGFIFNSFSFNFQMVLSIFMFILFMNFFSLVPYGLGLSSMHSTFFMSLFMWSSLFFFLLFKNFNSNISHFLPIGTPLALVPLLVWIEVVSVMARPVALGVRLMANIMAGHLLLHLGSSGMEFLGMKGFLILPIFFCLLFLEICVAAIQSYVFTMLLVLYTEEGE
uniref:ATP synthase subunit a n=1 Tax=Aplidium conicum TaxID=286149 RepID=D1GKZ9_APLCO|nr:ATP synthase F0 subunit 6 [Aplidium conicum]CAX68853.1 ATPase subunit 6 [Aplidium conicum]